MRVRGTSRRVDLVIVGTEGGVLVALDEASGRVVWRRALGSTVPGPVFGCPSFPDRRYGITGTPVLDRATGRVYAVSAGRAYAVRLADGRIVPRWPVAVADPAHEHVWDAVALSGGLLYFGTASYCDQPPYDGRVVAVDVRTARVAAQFFVTGASAGRPSGGGVWGWGGVSVDPRDGDVYAATGNSLTPSEDAGRSERVVRLTRALRVRQSNAPVTGDTVLDRDFGATPALLHPDGCPRMLSVVNKDGELLTYDRDRISRGPLQRLTVARGDPEGYVSLIGVTAFAPATRMLYVSSPSDPSATVHRRGLLAFHIGRDCRLRLVWRNPAHSDGLTSAPMIAGDVVSLTTGVLSRLVAVDARTGTTLSSTPLGTAGAFAAPTPVDDSIIAAGWDGLVRRLTP